MRRILLTLFLLFLGSTSGFSQGYQVSVHNVGTNTVYFLSITIDGGSPANYQILGAYIAARPTGLGAGLYATDARSFGVTGTVTINAVYANGPTAASSTFTNTSSAGPFSSYQTVSIPVSVNSTSGCLQNLSFTVTDHSQYGNLYGIVDTHTAPVGSGMTGDTALYNQYYASTFVRPNGSATLVLNNVPCSNVGWYQLETLGINNFETTAGTNSQTFTQVGTGAIVPTNGFVSTDVNPSGAVYNPGGSNSNILWTASAYTNSSLAVQQGDSALYDALTKAAAAAHSDESAIASAITNGVLAAHIDALGISNAVAHGGSTNGTGVYLGPTNGATENTLQGISNLLGNATGMVINAATVSVWQAQGTTYGATGSNELNQTGTLPSSTEALGDAIGDDWQITVPYLNSYVIDLNPFHVTWVVDLAAFFKSAITWISMVGLFYSNITVLLGAIKSSGSYRQAEFGGASVEGNTIANISASVVVAIAITVAMLALPAIGYSLAGWDFSLSSVFTVPFHATSAPHTVRVALYITDQFFPVMFMVYCTLCGMLYRMKVSAAVWVVQVVVRFTVAA